jgi:CHAD domain-containing protein
VLRPRAPAPIVARPAPAPPLPDFGWTLARHLSTTTSAHAAALLDTDPWTETGHDAETLRKIRVASRRLRVMVALFEPWLRPKLARRLRRNLRRVGRVLGRLREWDACGEALQARLARTADGAQAAAIEHLLVDIARHRADARGRAREALEQLDRSGLRRDLDQAIAASVAPFIRRDAEPCGEVWTLLRPRIESAFASAPIPNDLADEVAVHRVRIEAKRLRYAYDLLEPALADARARRRLKAVQRVIGEARDRSQLAELVAEHCRMLHDRGHTRLAAGLAPLVDALRAEADAAHARIAAALTHFDRTKILAATQTALGTRPLALVPDESTSATADRR